MKAKMRAKIRRRATRSGVRWYVALIDKSGTETAHGGFPTKREATVKARDLLGRRRRASPSGRTVEDYLEEWLSARENADLSATTRDTDRTVVGAWIGPHIGKLPLQELEEDPTHLDRLYAVLRREGGRGGRPCAVSRSATST